MKKYRGFKKEKYLAQRKKRERHLRKGNSTKGLEFSPSPATMHRENPTRAALPWSAALPDYTCTRGNHMHSIQAGLGFQVQSGGLPF